MRRLPLLLLLAAALTLAACTTTTPPALTDRDWALVWVPAFPTMPDGVATPKVRFGSSDGRLTGEHGV